MTTAETSSASEVETAPAVEVEAGGGEHLATLRAPEIDMGDTAGQVVEVDGETGEALDAEPEVMTKDAFWIVFRTGFDLPGYLAPVFRPLGIQDGEEHQGRAASDAVHDLLSIYYPKALMPMGDTVALLIAAAPFFIAKAIVFRSIMGEVKAPKRPEKEQASQPGRQKSAETGDQAGTPVPANEDYKPRRGTPSPTAWMDGEVA